MEITTTETLPVEASMSGGNTCYLYCPSLSRRSNYGVCLYTIRAFKEGRLQETSDCYSLVGRGLCEALSYQKQEQEAGRALFYKAREIKTVTLEPGEEKPSLVTEPSKPESESYMRGWNQAGESTKAPKKPAAARPKPKAAKKSTIFGTDTVDLSDAVDAAMEAEKKPAPKPEKKKSSIRSGMSILERARAMAGGS